MLRTCLEKLIDGSDLSIEESQTVIREILRDAHPYQVAAFLALLRAKGETASELFGMALAMRERMIRVPIDYPTLDIVGTGGDGAHTINISTGASILAASCGVKIAKHGNRSVSSLCGSADVLEALGVNIHLAPEAIAERVDQTGFGFLYAPLFHPAMKKMREIRSKLGLRTAFHLLGPILNPAGAAYQMIGVSDPQFLHPVADVLLKLGTVRSFVFHGSGLDELSCVGAAHVLEVTPEGIQRLTLDPEALGLQRCSLEDLKGGTAQENAARLQSMFRGEKDAAAGTLILNAAAALHLYGIASSIEEGIATARENLNQGKAHALLEKLQHA